MNCLLAQSRMQLFSVDHTYSSYWFNKPDANRLFTCIKPIHPLFGFADVVACLLPPVVATNTAIDTSTLICLYHIDAFHVGYVHTDSNS